MPDSVDIDALLSPEGEFVTESELMRRAHPFIEQPPPGPMVVPSAQKNRTEQLRVNKLTQEVAWYREQQLVYANTIGIAVRGKQWQKAEDLLEEVKLFHLVFDVLERKDTDLAYRTQYIEKAIETYQAPSDWADRWRARAQMR